MFHIVLYYVFCSVGSIFIGFCCAFSPCICDNPHKTAINCPSNFFWSFANCRFPPCCFGVAVLWFFNHKIESKGRTDCKTLVRPKSVTTIQMESVLLFYTLPLFFLLPAVWCRVPPAPHPCLQHFLTAGFFMPSSLWVLSFITFSIFFTLCVCLLRLQRAVLGCDWCGWGCCDWDGCWHCCLRFRRTMRYIHCEFVCNGNGNGG